MSMDTSDVDEHQKEDSLSAARAHLDKIRSRTIKLRTKYQNRDTEPNYRFFWSAMTKMREGLWSELLRSEERWVPYAMVISRNGEAPMVASQTATTEFREWIASKNTRNRLRYINHTIWAYLHSFQDQGKNMVYYSTLGNLILDELTLVSKEKRSDNAKTWLNIHQRYSTFNPKLVKMNCAKHLWTQLIVQWEGKYSNQWVEPHKQELKKALRQCGLSHSFGNLRHQVISIFLSTLYSNSQWVGSEHHLSIILAIWAQSPNDPTYRKSIRPLVLNCLYAISKNVAFNNFTKNRVVEFIKMDDLFKDPRTHPENWTSASMDFTKTVIRWLENDMHF